MRQKAEARRKRSINDKPPEVEQGQNEIRRRRGTRRGVGDRNYQLKTMKAQSREVKLHPGILARLRSTSINKATSMQQHEQAPHEQKGEEQRAQPHEAMHQKDLASRIEERTLRLDIRSREPAAQTSRRELLQKLEDVAKEQVEKAAKKKRMQLTDKGPCTHQQAEPPTMNSTRGDISRNVLHDGIRGVQGEWQGIRRIQRDEMHAIDNLIKAGRHQGKNHLA